MRYSDEPILVTSSRRDYRRWAAIAVVLALVGSIASIPVYNRWLDGKSRSAERGALFGAVYPLQLDGAPHRLELGWIAGPKLAVPLTPAPAPGTTLRISGDFGEEVLAWDAQKNVFGPAEATLDPFAHRRVRLSLERDGRVRWSGTRWAFGVVESGGGGHGH